MKSNKYIIICVAVFAIMAFSCFYFYNKHFVSDSELVKEYIRVNSNVRSFEEVESLICLMVERSNLYAVAADEKKLKEHDETFASIESLIDKLYAKTLSVRRKKILSQIKYGVTNHHNNISKLQQVRDKIKLDPTSPQLKKEEGELIFAIIDRSSLGFLRLSIQLKEENNNRLKELEKTVINLIP